MGLEGSLTRWQGPATGIYPESDASNPHLLHPEIHSNIILQHMPTSSKWSLSSRFFDQNFVRISDLSHACYIPADLILLDLNLITLIIFT